MSVWHICNYLKWKTRVEEEFNFLLDFACNLQSQKNNSHTMHIMLIGFGETDTASATWQFDIIYELHQ